MRIRTLVSLMLPVAYAMPALATVAVTTPTNNATVGSTVQVVASSSTTCAKGVASSGIYIDNALTYTVKGTSVNTAITLKPGKHSVVVQEWDNCGGASTAPLTLTVPTVGGVTVASPANGATVGTPAPFVASATTNCAQGVAAMGVYVNNSLMYKANGATLNAPITMGVGQQTAVVQAWDNCGGSTTTPVTVAVTGTTIPNIQAAPGWNQWGELAPTYNICNAPCSGITWSMLQHQTVVSTSGNSTEFKIGGTTPYSDVLWSNPVIGQGNLQGLTDANHKLLPTLHNFTLDTDVYVSDLAATQDLEFDINMYENGVGMEWGTECNHLADGVWDIWNNVNAQWVPTTIPCQLNNAAWNHVTLQVQREANNVLLYQSVTVNGVVHPINVTVQPFAVPSGWWGMTVNYQMDGDYAMQSNVTYLDKTNFTYW
jgi:hypothetical protein